MECALLGEIVAHTDKTDPWWVKRNEHPVAVHDHRHGACDLSAVPPLHALHRRDQGNCYWDADWYRPEFGCGCYHCRPGDYGARRRELRAPRASDFDS